jgi:hypothetical protein
MAFPDQEFDVHALESLVNGPITSFSLHAKPLSSLTQEDFEKMCDELSGSPGYRDYEKGAEEFKRWKSNNPHEYKLHWNEADWLRNHGYYLGEECIKEFVKLK